MPSIEELKVGERFDGFFRLRELDERETRGGKPYLDVVLEDRTGALPGKVWEIAEQVMGQLVRGGFVKVRATPEDYRGTLQLRVERIRPVTDADREDGFREADCVEQTPYDIDVMWEEARRIAQGCHPIVARLVFSVLDEYEERFRAWPASVHIHHPYLGGLLEHTLSVTKTCIYFAGKYDVARDLLVAAALLHDVGKLHELATDAGTYYTSEGRLIGHIVLGRDIVREHARRLGDVPEDFLLHLDHLILAHQGQPEWGTVKVPMTREALLLHYADDADAKFNHVQRAIERDRTEEDFTGRDRVMQRAFYKPLPALPPREDGGEEPPSS